MVKPDVKINYYADLELPPDSSIDDIRKQYRKLALKYHPDRNSGNEAECVPKFQAIQAAFEVLSDPDTKAKYDADRRKAGLYPRPSARPGPSYATGFTPTSGRPSFRPSPTSPQETYSANLNGAFRYTNANFPRPPGAGGPPRKENPQERAEAWNRMNHNRPHNAQSRRAEANAPPPPPPPPPPSSAQWESGPRSPWVHQDERGQPKPTTPRTNSTRAPRPGFDPQHSRADERQASGKSAYAHHAFRPQRPTAERRQTDFVPPPPPTAPPNTAPPYTYQRADPASHFRSRYSDEEVPFSEGKPRPRMPYTTSTGEKTYISSEALKRSASTRVPPRPGSSHATTRKDAFESHQARPRSASPSASHNAQAPSPAPGENLSGTNHSKTFTGKNPPSRGSRRPHAQSSDPEISATNSSSSSDGSSSAASANRRKATPASVWRGRNAKFSQNNDQGVDGSAKTNHTKGGTVHGNNPNIFAPNSGPFVPNRPNNTRSRSHEHIARFSPSEWQGKFSGDYFEARPSSQTRRRSPTKAFDNPKPRVNSTDAGTTQMPPPPPRPPPPTSHPPPSDGLNVPQPGEVKFSPEEWSNMMKQPNWAYPPEKPPSPSRATPKSRPTGRKQSTSKAKTSTIPKPVQVDPAVDEEQDSDVKHDSGAASASSSSLKEGGGEHDGNEADIDDTGDAMDIDQETPVPPPTQKEEPRMVSVPPANVQKRTDSPRNGAHVRHASQPTIPQQNPPQPSRKSSAGEDLKTNLSDLTAGAPFVPPKDAGLSSVSNMTSGLPFDSKASTTHPTKSFTPRTFDLPKPPEAPAMPTNRPTRASWDACVASMTSYMKEWSLFDRTMLNHFNSRSIMLQRLTQPSAPALTPTASMLGAGAPSDWLAARGESTNRPGFDTYLQGLREDEKVQEHWKASCEKHKVVVEEYNKMREKVRSIGVGV